jgi:hypothetical protein
MAVDEIRRRQRGCDQLDEGVVDPGKGLVAEAAHSGTVVVDFFVHEGG